VQGPPPGAYEWQDIDHAFKPVSRMPAAFGVSDARLPKWSTRMPQPGPGQYSPHMSWQKRSYNITLDDTRLE
jgi:hypothetical protein